MPDSPVAAYLDLLNDQLAADTQARIDQHQAQHGLSFGDRPMCMVLRPRFLTLAGYRFLQGRVKVLLGAFEKALTTALADPRFRLQFGLTPEEDELAMLDPGFHPFPTSRLDSFYVSDSELRFTEYNTETPAGAAYNNALSLMFLGLPVFQAFSRLYQVYPLPTHYGVLGTLLSAYEQWSGRRELPRIAILDWKEVPTYSEFVLYQDLFRRHGIQAVIVDPREVVYEGGRLKTPDGMPIDLIYKRVLISELIQHGGLNHPVVRAVRAKAVCMVNPFRCKILYKKASLAVLSDERNGGLFSDQERQAIADHIPWTRVLEERKTSGPLTPPPPLAPPLVKGGKGGSEREGVKSGGPQLPAPGQIDLVPFVLGNKDRLVLKPNDDYGGKGIVLGWTALQSAWEQAVSKALSASPASFIVQERVNLPREHFPYMSAGKLAVSEMMLDTNPFVCHGQYVDGCLTRISSADLLNVTAGTGSTVPTFLVEPR